MKNTEFQARTDRMGLTTKPLSNSFNYIVILDSTAFQLDYTGLDDQRVN